jgi:hypothetical protein
MSKNNIMTDSDLRNFEKEVQAQLKLSENELAEFYQENTKSLQEYEKRQEKFNNMFSNPELDKEADKELNKIAEEMGITFKEDNSFKELEAQINNMPEDNSFKELEDRINNMPEDNSFKELEAQINNMPDNQSKFAFQRADTVSNLLKSHAIIAEESINQSKDNQEITELKSFVKGVSKLSESIDKISDKSLENKDGQIPKKTVHNIMSTIGSGLKKIYGGLTAGLSKSVDFIKNWGNKLASAVKSLFEKTPKQQNAQFSNTINDTNKGLNKLENKPNIAAAKELLKKQFLKLQNDYSKVIPSERQAVFNRWKEIKNTKVDKMSAKDLYSEVQKIRKGVLSQRTKNLQEKRGARASKTKTTNSQKPSIGM